MNLRRFFFGKPNVIQTREGARGLAFRSTTPNWILNRGLCMYRCEDFTAVPRGRRRDALDFKIPVWSPFEGTAYHAVWSGGVAMVWFWDSDKTYGVREEFVSLFPKSRVRTTARIRILPETVFYKRKPDGLHLQACLDGFEIQRWYANVLIDSFWFPEHPQASQLSSFLARQENNTTVPPLNIEEMPAPATNQMAPEPWPFSGDPWNWITGVQNSLLAACLFALVLVVLWQEARYWNIRRLENAAAGELDRLQEKISPMLKTRNTLIELRRTNLALLNLLRGPSQAFIMNEIDRAIPSPNAEFREWRYQEGNLKISIQDRNPDPIAYIRALEAVQVFEHVKAKKGPDRNRLELSLKIRN